MENPLQKENQQKSKKILLNLNVKLKLQVNLGWN
jgi:hypothetical protein